MHTPTERRNVVWICVALAALTIAAYWPARNADFVNFDDPVYVAKNLKLHHGLTFENIRWAFTTFYFGNWHPLTWLSYMLDCEWFGPNPAAMHRVNIALHVLNAWLVFAVLRRMTAALWASAVVAALFALHPLHVESVAWISERKDLLCAVFWLLTMWAYTEYARRRCAGWYAGAVAFFILGLMSKAMLVTLPFVLLLLDFWPLERVQFAPSQWFRGLRRLIVEKIPFFALAALASYVTYVAQRKGEAVTEFEALGLSHRVENALVAYARYIGRTFWPADLAVFYPHPGAWSLVAVIGAGALVLVASAGAVLMMRKRPYLFTGWFWFLGTLVPVIGLVQVGGQSMADRYTYIPLIGLFIALVWAGRERADAKPHWRGMAVVAVGTVLGLCAALTFQQSALWKSSLTLFAHAARVVPPDGVILNNLGDALLAQGRAGEAAEKFRQALALDPEDFRAWGNVGNVYLREGDLDKAIDHYRNSLRLEPESPEVHHNLGLALARRGQFSEALEHYRAALAYRPTYLEAFINMGNALVALGDPASAGTNYLAVIRLKPDFAPAHYNLGNAILALGRVTEATTHYQEAIRLKPDYADAHRQLAAALQQLGNTAQALASLEKAAALNPNDLLARSQLAALLNELSQTERAIAEYRAILNISPETPAALNNLAWILATHPEAKYRDGAEAVRLAERACELAQWRQAFFVGTLAAAYAETGRFEDAIKTATKAIELAETNGQKGLAEKNRELVSFYRDGRPWRESRAQRP